MYFENLTIKADGNYFPLEWFSGVELVEEYKNTYIAFQGDVEVARMHTFDDCPVHIEKNGLVIGGILSKEQKEASGQEYGEWTLELPFLWQM